MAPPREDLYFGLQSALDPAGIAASAIAHLTWVMFAGAGVVFAFVLLCLAWALAGPRGWRGWLASRGMIIGAGAALPIVALTVLLVYGLLLARDIVADPAAAVREIHMEGEQYWWRVRYPARPPAADDAAFETANELHVPVGEPVRLVLTTRDVIHSFWAPTLAGKLDMIPGQQNVLVLRADKPGVYRGQCAEFCGASHALMAFYVVVSPPEQFAAWAERQSRPAAEPDNPRLLQGRELFIASGCGACHTVRGTEARGRIGPDLTHVGSRRSLAAGILPNNIGAFAAWITSPHHLKPGVKMPPFDIYRGAQLTAIAAYLESLE